MTSLRLAHACCLALALAAPATAAEVTRTVVRVRLDPAHYRLEAEAELTTRGAGPLALRLGPGFAVEPAEGLRVVPAGDETALTAEAPAGTVRIRYARTFEPLTGPAHRLASEVSAYVGPEGAFLSGGVGWYPLAEGAAPLRVEVRGPFEALIEGDPVVREADGAEKRSVWERAHPVEPVALVAGPYEVTERKAGETTVYAFLYPEERELGPRYLEAAGRFLQAYGRRFGPYPHASFAVVENFLPTGYGFATFTLLGRTVIRLPFIIDTSLRHEVAHCWWGNGVLVDASEGNWCEALTTYCADYTRALEQGTARSYRWDTLADYTAYVRAGHDMPLSAFRARHDSATRSIGYGKGLMVFHAIRRRIGADRFERALRQIAAARLNRPTAWSDLLAIFSSVGGQRLAWIKEQWIDRAGAPSFALERADRSPDGVSLRLTDSGAAAWRLLLPVAVEDADGRSWERDVDVTLPGGSAVTLDLRLPAGVEPRTVTIDPGFDLFRRLARSELPPSFRAVLGHEACTVVVPTGGAQAEACGQAAQAIAGQSGAKIARADQAGPLRAGMIVLGDGPQAQAALELLPSGVQVDGAKVTTPEGSASGPGTLLVSCVRTADGGVALLVRGGSPEAFGAARKLVHYGRYAYVLFDDAHAVARGRPTPNEHGPLRQTVQP